MKHSSLQMFAAAAVVAAAAAAAGSFTIKIIS
jgi:hypothetical protein